jgi:phosphoribosylanthranilate isomerase
MTWVKICGTTSVYDAQISLAAGADALGFIFAPSPRQIEVAEAARIVASLPSPAEKIGVFVNATADDAAEVVQRVGLTGVQLHGDEVPEQLPEFRRTLGKCRIIKTLQASEMLSGGEENLAKYLSADGSVDAILLDSGSANQRGGIGVPFAWKDAEPLAASIRNLMPLIIAGGLKAENVAEAIRIFDPWGVDVVSGVESAPGKKDEAKLHDFVAAVRRAQVTVK